MNYTFAIRTTMTAQMAFLCINPCMLLIFSGQCRGGFPVLPDTGLFLSLEKALTFSIPLSQHEKLPSDCHIKGLLYRCPHYIINTLLTLG